VQEPLPPSLLQHSLRKPSFYLSQQKKPKKATDLDGTHKIMHKTPDVCFVLQNSTPDSAATKHGNPRKQQNSKEKKKESSEKS
jgi:hypothetical protein